jgi:hypothetical protein
MGKGPAIMTLVKLTRAELRLLDIQKARGIPYPDDIFAWRKATPPRSPRWNPRSRVCLVTVFPAVLVSRFRRTGSGRRR